MGHLGSHCVGHCGGQLGSFLQQATVCACVRECACVPHGSGTCILNFFCDMDAVVGAGRCRQCTTHARCTPYHKLKSTASLAHPKEVADVGRRSKTAQAEKHRVSETSAKSPSSSGGVQSTGKRSAYLHECELVTMLICYCDILAVLGSRKCRTRARRTPQQRLKNTMCLGLATEVATVGRLSETSQAKTLRVSRFSARTPARREATNCPRSCVRVRRWIHRSPAPCSAHRAKCHGQKQRWHR